MVGLGLVTLLVEDYDEAIDFFVETLDFVLESDDAGTGGDGSAKRWVVVRPRDGGAGLLLARASDADQQKAVGHQTAGRVGFFLEVDNFATVHARMSGAGVVFLEEPRHEVYGSVAVFLDVAGNRWDLLGPHAS